MPIPSPSRRITFFTGGVVAVDSCQANTSHVTVAVAPSAVVAVSVWRPADASVTSRWRKLVVCGGAGGGTIARRLVPVRRASAAAAPLAVDTRRKDVLRRDVDAVERDLQPARRLAASDAGGFDADVEAAAGGNSGAVHGNDADRGLRVRGDRDDECEDGGKSWAHAPDSTG